jgi:Spy/CpxP family protein refolding chaperone
MRRMLMASILAVVAVPGFAQAAVDPPVPLEEMLQILKHEDVRRELKLDAQQRQGLDVIAESMCITTMSDLDTLAPQSRKAKIEELLDKADLNTSTDAALLRLFSVEQQARFIQIKLHWLDVNALQLDAVAEALAITDAQRRTISKKLDSIRSAGGLEYRRKLEEIRDAVWNVLTSEQEAVWEKLAGPKPDIDQRRRQTRPALAYASQRGLLRYDSVQEELHLSPEQRARIEILTEKMRFASLNFLSGLKQDDPAIKKQIEQLDEVTQAGLTRILLPEQLMRFQQLQWQLLRDRSLEDNTLAHRIGLTDEQRAKIRHLNSSNPRPSGQRLSDEELRAWQLRGVKIAEELRAVLTPEQKRKWEELLGPKFDLSSRQRAKASE